MNPTEHAAHLRQTAEMMEQSARALERVEELESENDRLRRTKAQQAETIVSLHEALVEVRAKNGELVCTKRKMREQAVSALERVVELEAMDRKLGEARATIATLRRENETLARNVPPEPPADDPIFWNPYNGAVQDHRDGTVIQPDTDKERAKRGLPPLETEPPVLTSLRDRIKHAINGTAAENGSDTPDFILADYLLASLDAFDAAVRFREEWYGRELTPADVDF
jgi:hypothetical protein